MTVAAQPSIRSHGNETSQALACRTPTPIFESSSESSIRMSQRMNRAVSCESVNPVIPHIHQRNPAAYNHQLDKNFSGVRAEQVNSFEMRSVEQLFFNGIPKMNAVSSKAYRSVNPRFVQECNLRTALWGRRSPECDRNVTPSALGE
jgi:hypothetical protein